MNSLNSVVVRDAVIKDLPALAALMNELGYLTTVEEMTIRFENIRQHPDFRTLVAEYQNQVVGFAGITKNFSYESVEIYVRVMALVVDKSVRGKKIGFELIRAAESWAMLIKANRMVLTCGDREERKDAHLFYRRMGFEIQSIGYIKKIPIGPTN